MFLREKLKEGRDDKAKKDSLKVHTSWREGKEILKKVVPAKTEGINLQRVAKKLGLMNFNQVQTVLYESLIIFSMLTFVQRDY